MLAHGATSLKSLSQGRMVRLAICSITTSEYPLTREAGYVKDAPPPSYADFTGPTELGGSISAPLNNAGHDTYVGLFLTDLPN